MLIHHSGPSGSNTTLRGKVQTYALVAAALAAGALLIAFGLIVLAGLAVVGTIAGGAIAAYHRVTGRWPRFLHVRTYVGPLGSPDPESDGALGLDPSKEVFPPTPDAPRLPDEPSSDR